MMKVLFIDSAHPVLREDFEKAGLSCISFKGYTRDDYKRIIAEYDGIIIRSDIQMDKEMLDLASNLKFIGRVGAGMESIDVEYAERKNIRCFNSPEGNRDAVGEHALSMLLMLFNNLKRADNQVRKGIWSREENRGLEIKGKTVGIIGYGNMGSAFAQRLKGFECTVLAYDKYKTGFGNEFVKESTLQALFSQCEILSLHVPLTDETRYMFDEPFISKFSHPFYLINTARGPVVKTSALVNALKSGNIKGACLDVLEYEKFSFENLGLENLPPDLHYLFEAENVILTPHIAGWTVESKYKLAKVLGEKILAHLQT